MCAAGEWNGSALQLRGLNLLCDVTIFRDSAVDAPLVLVVNANVAHR